jgi:hypothetical protein
MRQTLASSRCLFLLSRTPPASRDWEKLTNGGKKWNGLARGQVRALLAGGAGKFFAEWVKKCGQAAPGNTRSDADDKS